MRALLLVLDSVGIGGAPDAAAYGDEGANTLGHIFEQVPELLDAAHAESPLAGLILASPANPTGTMVDRAEPVTSVAVGP